MRYLLSTVGYGSRYALGDDMRLLGYDSIQEGVQLRPLYQMHDAMRTT